MRNLGLFPCGIAIKKSIFLKEEVLFFIYYFPAWVGKKRYKVKKKIDCYCQNKV